MTDWQPWPPPADGELIEVEVPGARRHERVVGACCIYEGESWVTLCRFRGGPGEVVDGYQWEDKTADIPPTARWRRV